MVLGRDRRAEQGHDAVAGVLIDAALELVHRASQHREDRVEGLVPALRPQHLGDIHRAAQARPARRRTMRCETFDASASQSGRTARVRSPEGRRDLAFETAPARHTQCARSPRQRTPSSVRKPSARLHLSWISRPLGFQSAILWTLIWDPPLAVAIENSPASGQRPG